jgi:hypothetical protein
MIHANDLFRCPQCETDTIQIRHSWTSGDPAQGAGFNFHCGNGHPFEVQFHGNTDGSITWGIAETEGSGSE